MIVVFLHQQILQRLTKIIDEKTERVVHLMDIIESVGLFRCRVGYVSRKPLTYFEGETFIPLRMFGRL